MQRFKQQHTQQQIVNVSRPMPKNGIIFQITAAPLNHQAGALSKYGGNATQPLSPAVASVPVESAALVSSGWLGTSMLGVLSDVVGVSCANGAIATSRASGMTTIQQVSTVQFRAQCAMVGRVAALMVRAPPTKKFVPVCCG